MRATDLEIMERLQLRANDCGKRITFTHKLFFFRLVDYAISENNVAGDGLRVSLSEDEMASTFDISKRMVTQSLRVLSDCGILLRYRGAKKIFTTVAKKEFFERSENT